MTTASDYVPTSTSPFTSPAPGRQSGPPTRPIRIGLLGLGRVGSAVARRADAIGSWQLHVTAALVRDPHRRRDVDGIFVTTDPGAVFASGPSVVVEALGGLEPARTLVLEALARG